MDPKKIAEEIVKDLFNKYELVEEKDEDQEEEEGEEEEADEGEEESEDEGEEDDGEDAAPVKKAVGDAMKGSATTSAAASISLKGQLPQAAQGGGVAHDALGGGVALIGELNTTPDLLAKTDNVIKEVANGAVRYAGPVSKLLG